MKELLSALSNRYILWVIIAFLIGGSIFMRSCQVKENEQLQTYNRQLEGKLSEKERELQKLNTDLGLSRSELLTQEELAKRLKKDNEELDIAFEQFKKKHNLEIRSRDKTIAELKQQIDGGTTTVVVGGCDNIDKCSIAYSWTDALGRFKLTDPDIFKKNNERFESAQVFRVIGEIWKQKNGSLQTKRLVLREVTKNANGEYEPIENAKADIVDSKFEYHNPPAIDTEWSWKDLFRLRAVAIPSLTMIPDAGKLRLGVGLEFMSWKGLGINTHAAFDFEDVSKIEQRIGLAYSPKIFDLDLNVAVGVSAGTPFAHAFQEYSINLDLLFYITN